MRPQPWRPSRWLGAWLLTLLMLLASGFTLFWLARPRLLINHARFLTNARFYTEALQSWINLDQRFKPATENDVTERRTGERETLDKAVQHWQAAPPESSPAELRRFAEFFTLAESRPLLAPDARRGRLAILIHSDSPLTTQTL